MSTVSIFFVKTELELLSSELISQSFASNSYNILVHQNKNGLPIQNNLFNETLSVSYRRSRNPFALCQSIRENLVRLKDVIEQHTNAPQAINIHLPRISTSKSNYSINFLRNSFPRSEINVCIIPHGLVGIEVSPLPLSRLIKFIRRKFSFKRLFFPELDYYIARKDAIGFLDPIVKHIYAFRGMEYNYPPEKVRILSLDNKRNSHRGPEKVAIIVGQPLVKDGFAKKADVELIADKIHSWIQSNDFDIVYYSKHPRAEDFWDFYKTDYTLLPQDRAIETMLCDLQPDAIVSCYSTALATAKSILGDAVECISVGLNLTSTDKKQELHRHFTKSGVKIIE